MAELTKGAVFLQFSADLAGNYCSFSVFWAKYMYKVNVLNHCIFVNDKNKYVPLCNIDSFVEKM